MAKVPTRPFDTNLHMKAPLLNEQTAMLVPGPIALGGPVEDGHLPTRTAAPATQAWGLGAGHCLTILGEDFCYQRSSLLARPTPIADYHLDARECWTESVLGGELTVCENDLAMPTAKSDPAAVGPRDICQTIVVDGQTDTICFDVSGLPPATAGPRGICQTVVVDEGTNIVCVDVPPMATTVPSRRGIRLDDEHPYASHFTTTPPPYTVTYLAEDLPSTLETLQPSSTNSSSPESASDDPEFNALDLIGDYSSMIFPALIIATLALAAVTALATFLYFKRRPWPKRGKAKHNPVARDVEQTPPRPDDLQQPPPFQESPPLSHDGSPRNASAPPTAGTSRRGSAAPASGASRQGSVAQPPTRQPTFPAASRRSTIQEVGADAEREADNVNA